MLSSKKTTELSKCTDTQLVAMLREALSVTVASIVRTADIVKELESRGYDLDSLKLGVITWLRKIAHGQVLPEVYERYRHSDRLLRCVSSLPIPDQSRLSEPCTVPVLVLTDDGPQERSVDPIDMTPREISQVFACGAIRTLPEQRGYLDDKRVSRRNAVQTLEGEVKVDRRKKCLVINGLRLSRSQILSYLSHLED